MAKNIYELIALARALREKDTVNSISPEDVGGLIQYALEYTAEMEQSADGLGIRKVYKTKAAMNADTAPVGTNGKPLRYGQLVAIYDASNKTDAESGNVYLYQKPGWLLTGNITNIYGLSDKLDKEIQDRKDAVSAEQTARTTALNILKTALETAIGNVASNLSSEVTRAKEAEKENADDIFELQWILDGRGAYLFDGINTLPVTINDSVGINAGDNPVKIYYSTVEKRFYGVVGFANYYTWACNNGLSSNAYDSAGVINKNIYISRDGRYVVIDGELVRLADQNAIEGEIDAERERAMEAEVVLKTLIDALATKTLPIVTCNGILNFDDPVEEEGIFLRYSRKQVTRPGALPVRLNGNLDLLATGELVEECDTEHLYVVDDVCYVYDGTTCRPLGEHLRLIVTSMDEVKQELKHVTFVNVHRLAEAPGQFESLSAAATFLQSNDLTHYDSGVIMSFCTAEGWQVQQYVGKPSDDFTDEENWRAIGGGSSVGNIYNVSNEVPPTGGFYSLINTDIEVRSAVHVAKANKKDVLGLVITFAISDKVWKTYQFVGPTTDDKYWLDAAYWQDFGSLAAGTEPVVVINVLLNTTKTIYTLSSAIDALIAYEQTSKVTYRKTGLVLSYRISDNEYEAYQFCGQVTDFDDESFWAPFGSGSGDASDTPEAGGELPFSTGGAAKHIPVSGTFEKNEETGTLNLKFYNSEDEEQTGEPLFQIENIPMASGGGGGGSAGASINFNFDSNMAKTGAAGGEFIIPIEVESDDEVDTITVTNRSTGSIVKIVNNPRRDGVFYRVDVSDLFKTAGTVRLAVKVDAGSLSLTKNITLTAVDVTISCVQTLNYTSDTVVRVGGGTNSINCYKFANNVGTIIATTEIYINGEWRTLSTDTITSAATMPLEINPQDVFGDGSYKMAHGAYPVRIHGVDKDSGVLGNYLYTSVMCIDAKSDAPIIALMWLSDEEMMSKKLLESVEMNYAVYDPANTIKGECSFYRENSKTESKVLLSSVSPNRAQAYTLTNRVEDVNPTDGSVSLTYTAESKGTVYPLPLEVKVNGALVDIQQTAGVTLDISMDGRSNSDADKSIKSSFVNAEGETETYELTSEGCNYSTNGFVKDTFGTSQYNPNGNDGGRMAWRVAEDMVSRIDYPFFANRNVERNGAAFQMTFMTKNVVDDSAIIAKIFDGTKGLYITGQSIIFTTVGADPIEAASTESKSIRFNYTQGVPTTIALVQERADAAPKAGIALVKLFVNGEEVGACYYDTGEEATYTNAIFEFSGKNADFYLYDIKAWRTYAGDYESSFRDYLLDMSDTSTMIEEYEKNYAVMATQAITAEPSIPGFTGYMEKGTKLRPQVDALVEAGMPVIIVCANGDAIENGYIYGTQLNSGNFPSWLESMKSDKKSKIYVDIYVYFPDRPWASFKAVKVPMTNQGTTSSARAIKNIKMKLKGIILQLIYSRDHFTSEDERLLWDKAYELAQKGRFQIYEDSVPSNIITIKVDYSESGGAHNGAYCELYNKLQRALGEKYMTPAQIAYDKTNPKYIMNTSIDSIPCAYFRTDTPDPNNAYFHAKGNFNQDKGDAKVFGFEDVDGYNKGCLNYGDFTEVVVTTLADGIDNATVLAQKASAYVSEKYREMDASEIYMFSEFCGSHYKFYKDNGEGEFVEVPAVDDAKETEFTLDQMNANTQKFALSATYKTKDGKFVHYVSAGFEDVTGSFYFNSVTGKWVIEGYALNPVECYEIKTYTNMAWFRGVSSAQDMLDYTYSGGHEKWTTYFESRYPDDDDLNALYDEGKKLPFRLYKWLMFCNECDYETGDQEKWRKELYKIANPYSCGCYHCATDVTLSVDQRSKNMMLGFLQEKDGSVRLYLNFLYDGDGIWTADNNCGQTVPVDCDPNSEDGEKWYQGYGSVLFKNISQLGEFVVDDSGKVVTISEIYNEMRAAATPEGIIPFSPSGCEQLWLNKRLKKWPKLVSSFDGERKYIGTMAYDDTYLYALHGLGLSTLPQVFAKRFQLRDGFYGGPSFRSDSAGFRGVPNNSRVGITFTITAARAGYFSIGVEGADASRLMPPVHLEAGESHTFVTGVKNSSNDGSAMYVIGASQVAKLDISSSTWKSMDFSAFTLLEELVIGGEAFAENAIIGALSTIDLGQKAYLKKVDIRNTSTTNINLSGCPRLQTLLADGSKLNRFTLAEASRISEMSLPETIEQLSAVNLQNLSYTGLNATNGIKISAWTNLTRLTVENCSGINIEQLLKDVVMTQRDARKIARLRIITEAEEGNGEALLTMLQWSVGGIDINGSSQAKPYYEGEYILNVIREPEDIDSISEGYEAIDLSTGLSAFISFIDEINGEDYSGEIEPGLPEITLDNIDEVALTYYNGETAEEWMDDYANSNS